MSLPANPNFVKSIEAVGDRYGCGGDTPVRGPKASSVSRRGRFPLSLADARLP